MHDVTQIRSPRAAIYTRQSKDSLGTGLAVARQLAEDEKLCAARGWTVMARLTDNDVSASNGKPRPAFTELMRLVDTEAVDVIVVWAVDRLVRRLADLETVISACEKHGVRLATVSGDLDLSTDQGRLVGRILASVARGEVERKSARQKLAYEQAADAGKRRTSCPRAFGWQADRVTIDPAEAAAIRDAADALLGGGTLTGVAREWTARGLRPPKAPYGPLVLHPWDRKSIRGMLTNPAVAGIATKHGEETGVRGEWEPILTEETWRAVVALLGDPGRKQARAVQTLLGGIGRCPCGNYVTGSVARIGYHTYRCNAETQNGRAGPHTGLKAEDVNWYVAEVMVGRLSRDDVGDLITPPPGIDTTALHREAVSLRKKMETDAVDEMKGSISRAQLRARSEYATRRLAEIGDSLAAAAVTSVLAPFANGEPAREVWDGLGLDRQRAVVDELCMVTLLPRGKGVRTFDPAKVVIAWRDK